MKLPVSKTNAPVWRDITVKSVLPEALKPLETLSRNLWWVWNSAAKNLFRDLDPDLWRATGENPVMLLQQLSSERLEEVMNDADMMDRIKNVFAMFNSYMAKPMRKDIPSVSYFSMEYGLCNCLKIYSGGLGVLAGDYIKEASDSCVDMTAIGFLYRYGYFTQSLSVDGQQIANYEPQNFNQLPIEQVTDENGHPLILEVPYPGRIIYSHIWRVNVGRMKLYLLDTDFDMNSEYDRSITHQLYGGDWENRIKQEYLLGIGGVLALKKLGISNTIYHANEGHAALLNLQRLVDYVESGLDFNTSLELVRSSSLYTVHTPGARRPRLFRRRPRPQISQRIPRTSGHQLAGPHEHGPREPRQPGPLLNERLRSQHLPGSQRRKLAPRRGVKENVCRRMERLFMGRKPSPTVCTCPPGPQANGRLSTPKSSASRYSITRAIPKHGKASSRPKTKRSGKCAPR